jgi:hypothetical protein
LNEMGRIWSLSRFRHALCWREEGIVWLWWSVDVLVIVIAIAPWSSYFVNSSETWSSRWSSKSHQNRRHFASMIWILRGRAFRWGNARPGLGITVVLHLRTNKLLS